MIFVEIINVYKSFYEPQGVRKYFVELKIVEIDRKNLALCSYWENLLFDN